ncbi:MAG TPA: outer membrane beta-barrel protein [Anaeromyxobacter sp.]
MRTKPLVAAALLAVAFSAAAQERPKVGLGIGIAPFAVPGSGAATVSRTVELYVPIAIAPQFRLEPSLGISTDDEPGNGTDTRDFTLGIGAFLVSRLAPTADMYVGGRLRLNFAKVSNPVASDTGTDLQIAAAIGGEVYLVPRFSLGLEGELGLFQNSRVSGDNDGVFTTGIAFLRVYF